VIPEENPPRLWVDLTAIYAQEVFKTIFLTGGIAEKSHLFFFQLM